MVVAGGGVVVGAGVVVVVQIQHNNDSPSFWYPAGIVTNSGEHPPESEE